MKHTKLISCLTAGCIAATLACAGAFADEVPQNDAGKKFESDFASAGALIQVNYEEEGYRVVVDLRDQEEEKGTIWQYSCYYNEEKDCLQSISSSKSAYTVDPDNGATVLAEPEYQGLDTPETVTEFAFKDNGMLAWQEGHENIAPDMEFRDIGTFQGVWRNEAEKIWVAIRWEGLNEEQFNYTVLINREGEDSYTEFNMQGLPNLETGKLEAFGGCTVYTRGADGTYEPTVSNEIFEAYFSDLGGGKILYETANGIELTYDMVANPNDFIDGLG